MILARINTTVETLLLELVQIPILPGLPRSDRSLGDGLNRRPNARHRLLAVRELRDLLVARDAVPDLYEPAQRPVGRYLGEYRLGIEWDCGSITGLRRFFCAGEHGDV